MPVSVRNSQMTSRAGATGISHQPGSRGKGKQYNSRAKKFEIYAPFEIYPPLPTGSIIRSPIGPLKSLNLANAMLDGLTVVGGLIALVVFFGSLPLAVGLMIFGVF